ncbi:MAG: YesL family protein [Clostridiales bacterium]|nr:YesL family protein [Clostridiales bacterium]
MGSLFSLDGPVARVLGRAADFLILSLLWVVFSIPLITLGASTTALYTMTLRMVRDEDGKLIEGFWNAFRSNFKQATVIHLILTAVTVLLWIYWRAVSALDGSLRMVFTAVFGLFLLQWLLVVQFIYPVLARFQNSVLNILKNAWVMAVSGLPYFLVSLVFTGLPLWTLLLNTNLFVMILPLWIFMGPGLIAWLNSFLFHQCFKKYIPEEEETEEIF